MILYRRWLFGMSDRDIDIRGARLKPPLFGFGIQDLSRSQTFCICIGTNIMAEVMMGTWLTRSCPVRGTEPDLNAMCEITEQFKAKNVPLIADPGLGHLVDTTVDTEEARDQANVVCPNKEAAVKTAFPKNGIAAY